MLLKNLKNAWLSPKGELVNKHKYFYNERSYHNELALCILSDIWDLNDPMDAFDRLHETSKVYATEELENLGWIRLHGFQGMNPKWVIPFHTKITKSQKEVILDWCIENNVRYNDCFSK